MCNEASFSGRIPRRFAATSFLRKGERACTRPGGLAADQASPPRTRQNVRMNTQAAQADQARIHQARAHAAQHRIGEAEAVYRKILADAPDTPEALNFVAMCSLSRGDPASAQRDLERAARLEPTQPEIWKNL